MDYAIEPLAPRHDRAAFSCGEPSLDTYIQRQAGQDVKRDLAICYILISASGHEHHPDHDALQRALRTGVGVKLVIVDALNERAASFYERRDFQRLKDYPLRLFLPTSKIREMFPSEGKEPNDP